MIDTAKIKTFFIKKYKLMLFLIIFIFVCFVYNLNNFSLNYILKRGTLLEYSISNQNKNIEDKLNDLNVKYLAGKVFELDEVEYDFDNEPVRNVLLVRIPLLLNEKNTMLVNKISDFVFENDNNAKLINVSTLGSSYNDSYSAFLKFFFILLISTFLFCLTLQIFFNKTFSFESLKNIIKSFFAKQKEGFKELVKKTKEKGFLYLLKKILFDDTEDENGNEKETSFTKEIVSTVVFVLVCVIIIRYFIGELRWIPSGSMRPTILEKDRVFVEKLDFPKKEIKRGDILVFYPPEVQLSNTPLAVLSRLSGIFCKDIAFIKRVVGMPNDKFEIKKDFKNGQYRVYINDKALNEPYISSKTNWTPCMENMYCGPFIIPENHYFMMGDNRNNSQDSRFWGFLNKDRIIGRANFMFFPIRRINVLKDKYVVLHKKQSGKLIEDSTYIIDRY